MPLLLPVPPPAILHVLPKAHNKATSRSRRPARQDPSPLDKAAFTILSAYDDGLALPKPRLKGQAKREVDWLLSALTDSPPVNPFPKGSRAFQEAQKVRQLLTCPAEKRKENLQAVNPVLTGSHAALWRWGQALNRAGNMPKSLRQAWENLLLLPAGTGITRGWALRHSLCLALLEGDEKRLVEIKEWIYEEDTGLYKAFQRAFAMLGGPAPRYYLWSLPDLEPLDVPLFKLGKRIWISPPELPPPHSTSDDVWILPALQSNQSADDAFLSGPSQADGKAMLSQLEGQEFKGRLCFAPSRSPFEASAFMFFPVEILLDGNGLISRIRIGDAARMLE